MKNIGPITVFICFLGFIIFIILYNIKKDKEEIIESQLKDSPIIIDDTIKELADTVGACILCNQFSEGKSYKYYYGKYLYKEFINSKVKYNKLYCYYNKYYIIDGNGNAIICCDCMQAIRNESIRKAKYLRKIVGILGPLIFAGIIYLTISTGFNFGIMISIIVLLLLLLPIIVPIPPIPGEQCFQNIVINNQKEYFRTKGYILFTPAEYQRLKPHNL